MLSVLSLELLQDGRAITRMIFLMSRQKRLFVRRILNIRRSFLQKAIIFRLHMQRALSDRQELSELGKMFLKTRGSKSYHPLGLINHRQRIGMSGRISRDWYFNGAISYKYSRKMRIPGYVLREMFIAGKRERVGKPVSSIGDLVC